MVLFDTRHAAAEVDGRQCLTLRGRKKEDLDRKYRHLTNKLEQLTKHQPT